jgi:hypothetical protein
MLGEAEYHIRRPMPGITAGASPTPRHGGWWRPKGAASHRPHARSVRPKATQAIGPNPVPTIHLVTGRIDTQPFRIQQIAAREVRMLVIQHFEAVLDTGRTGRL